MKGTAGAPITFTACKDEKVTLDGSRSVEELGSKGWTQHKGSIYKTTLSVPCAHGDCGSTARP